MSSHPRLIHLCRTPSRLLTSTREEQTAIFAFLVEQLQRRATARVPDLDATATDQPDWLAVLDHHFGGGQLVVHASGYAPSMHHA
jgi:hypothetical protein